MRSVEGISAVYGGEEVKLRDCGNGSDSGGEEVNVVGWPRLTTPQNARSLSRQLL